MKKSLTIILVAVATILLALNYGLLNKKASFSGEIKIGSILILSGEGASWGEATRNGIELALQQINNNGGVSGKRLSVINEDNASSPTKAISAFQKLTEFDGVKFIIGPNWSNSGLPLVDLAKQKKVVMISPSLGVKEFNEANQYLFNTWPHDFILSRNLADYVYKAGYRKIALFGAQDVYVKDQTKNFEEEFQGLGGKIAFSYEPVTTETDVRTQVAKVKNDKSIDAVIMTIDGFSLTDIVAKELKAFSVNLPVFSITIDKKIISDCNGACDGMIFPTFLTPEKSFESAYQQKFNREVEIGSDSAYDAVMMLAKAMTETNSTDPDVIAKYLAGIKEYNGVSGHLVSDGKRAFTKPYAIYQILNGKPIKISP